MNLTNLAKPDSQSQCHTNGITDIDPDHIHGSNMPSGYGRMKKQVPLDRTDAEVDMHWAYLKLTGRNHGY